MEHKNHTKLYLITGGAGFVGNSITNKLISLGNRVIVLDDFSKAQKSNLLKSNNLFIYKGDVCDKSIYKKISIDHGKIDAIIHLAAKHFIPECNLNYSETLRVNVAGTGELIQWANENSISKIIYASSAAVYGSSHNKPIKESCAKDPDSIYGYSKSVSEELFKLYKGQYVILRFFNIFGPKDKNKHLIPSIIEQVIKNKSINIGNLSPKRDYIHVDDVTDAIIKSLDYNSNSNIFNIGSGTATSVMDVVKQIKDIFKLKTSIEPDIKLIRKVDTPYLCADISRAQTKLDWRPQISLEEGLKITVPTQIKN